MKRHIWTWPRMIVAAVILIFPTKSAQGFLWLTAADRWYPPLQTAADPAYALATVLMVTLAVYVVAGIFYFTVPKVAAPMRPRDHISWVDEYSDLKSRFTPLIANAGNLTEAEAGERIANRLAPPPARRQLIFARGTERHEALRAALYIYKSAHLAVWDFNDASHHLERAIRSELWKLLLATGRDANQSASELVIVLRPPVHLARSTASALSKYLEQRGYPHTVVPPIWQPESTRAGSALARASAAWWMRVPSDAVTLVAYSRTQDPQRLDDEFATIRLIASAAALARIPLTTSTDDLASAKALLEHQAELLALRGYAPPELREHDSYTGIADTRELAHWALREIVLDTRDTTILTKDAA